MTQDEQELMDAAIQLAIVAEREACAKIAENWTTPFEIPLDFGPVKISGLGKPIAAAIRNRNC